MIVPPNTSPKLTSGLSTVPYTIDLYASKIETIFYSDADLDLVTFPTFTKNPYNPISFVTATAPSTPASSGSI